MEIVRKEEEEEGRIIRLKLRLRSRRTECTRENVGSLDKSGPNASSESGVWAVIYRLLPPQEHGVERKEGNAFAKQNRSFELRR